MKNLKVYLAAVVLGFLLLAPLVAAAEGLNIMRSFKSGETELAIATYTEGGRTVGLLGMNNAGHRISIALGRKDWEQMRALVKQAAAVQGGSGQEIGGITETGTKSPSHLAIAINPATMRFVISDAAIGTYDYLLQRSDVSEFLSQSAEAAKIMTE